MHCRTKWLLIPLLFASALRAADPAGAFQVRIEIQDSKGKEFADQSVTLCQEWYPKINAALFGQGISTTKAICKASS
jgi:hypothetical protein